MPWRPNVTVAAIIERGRRYLIVEERDESRLVLNQPAGHLETHEDLVEAIIREVGEETCRAFTPAGLVGIYLYEQASPKPSYLRFCFHGSVGNVQTDWQRDTDIHDVHWLSREDLMARQEQLRSPMVLETIRDYEDGQDLPLQALRAFLI